MSSSAIPESNAPRTTSVYRCPNCHTDSFGGKKLNPLIRDLHRAQMIVWEGSRISFSENGKKIEIKEEGDHRVIFSNGKIEVVKLRDDEEPTSARQVHEEEICGIVHLPWDLPGELH